MKFSESEAAFQCSGRETLASGGVIGIDQRLRSYQGSEGHLAEHESVLTKDERTELADHMINLWTQFKTR